MNPEDKFSTARLDMLLVKEHPPRSIKNPHPQEFKIIDEWQGAVAD